MSYDRIPKIGPKWVKFTDRWQEFITISEPHHWISHWDTEAQRSRRCGEDLCYMCAIGVPKQLRVVILCRDSKGHEVLIELRERHREVFEHYEPMTGLRFKARKMGTARNSPVEVVPMDFAAAVARDISRLVDSFGLAPVVISDADLESPKTHSKASTIAVAPSDRENLRPI